MQLQTCKLIKILPFTNYPPIFCFKLIEEEYFFSFEKITSDSRIELRCQNSGCRIQAFVDSLIEVLGGQKKIINDSVKYLTGLFEKSDPVIFQSSGYDARNFLIRRKHKHHAPQQNRVTKISYKKSLTKILAECDILKIEKEGENLSFHIKINEKVYYYRYAEIHHDFDVVLECADHAKNWHEYKTLTKSEPITNVRDKKICSQKCTA